MRSVVAHWPHPELYPAGARRHFSERGSKMIGAQRARRGRSRPLWPKGAPKDGILLSWRVPPESAGMRLDRFIQQCIPRLTRTRAQAITRACAYTEEGRRRRPSEQVRAEETVILVRTKFEEPPAPKNYTVVHQDEALLVLDKPAGLPVHPSATYHKNTLSYVLREHYGEPAPRLAHRLDRETSGVLVCTRTKQAERDVKGLFENRRVEKAYLAIVRGLVSAAEGCVDQPLRAASDLHLLMEAGSASDLHALTQYHVLARAPAHSLVWLKPHTGRQHQLRVHMSLLGHPIVGDKLYGPEGPTVFFDVIEQGMTAEITERLGHERQALHAVELSLEHPVRRVRCRFHAPMPADMVDLWKKVQGGSLGGVLPTSGL